MTGNHDIGVYNPGIAYAYCVPECPSGFVDTPTCVVPADATRLILSYDFTRAIVTFPSTGSVTNLDAVVAIDGDSGLPASYRGIHFNGSNLSHIKIADGLVLNHSFSIFSWVYLFNLSARRVLFWKDRNDFSISNSERLLYIFVQSNGKVRI